MPVSRLIVLLLVGLVASGCDRQKPAEPQAPDVNAAETAAADAANGKGVNRTNKGKAAPATMFKDPAGKDVSIASFAGKPVLVNLWATWCAPCVKELPTLDRLTVERQLLVVAVSQDIGPQNSVQTFLDKHGIIYLDAYHDPEMALSLDTGAQVLPTTILFDAAGKEVWRYTGDLDWTGPEAQKLLAEVG